MSARLKRRTRHLAVAVGIVAVFALGAAAYAAIPDADGNFYACVANASGTIRLIQKSTTCRASEQRVSWPAGQADVPVTTTYRKLKQFLLPADDFVHESVECDDGDVATGGGFSTPATSPIPRSSIQVVDDNGVPVAWRVFLDNRGNGADGSTVSVICQHTE
jgi:hypothetical protein